MNGKLKNAKQELYRDLYLFCIFTGLSFSDLLNTGHKNIITTQIYAKITKEKLNRDMDNLSMRLNNIEEYVTIFIEGRCVAVTGYEVWMIAGEIAALLDTTVATVNNAVKRIWKRNVLRQGEHMRCVELGAWRSVDKYSLAIILYLSFRLATHRTQQLREWLLRRAVEQPKMQHVFFNINVSHTKRGRPYMSTSFYNN